MPEGRRCEGSAVLFRYSPSPWRYRLIAYPPSARFAADEHTTGRLPLVADKHTAAFWAGGPALIAVGGIFMTVTGFEPTKDPSTVWANSWFDLGFAFVILGLVITAVGVVMHFRREMPSASAPPAVSSPDNSRPAPPLVVNKAVWEAVCDESGEFPDTKTLTFRLKQIPAPGSAIRDFTALRCTVTDPAGSTLKSTDTDSWRHYTPHSFPGARQVRPGLYSSRWQGRLQTAEWVEIATGQHVVKAPPPLIVTIIDNKFENWKHIALIAALRVKITNTTGETIRLSGFGFTYDPEGFPVLHTSFTTGDERLELDRELYSRHERQHYGIPLRIHATVPARESITGWVLEAVPRRASGGSPSCTVVIRDVLGNEYPATQPKQEPQTYI